LLCRIGVDAVIVVVWGGHVLMELKSLH
jgi:hypothetical protein